jgi:cytochrome c553
MKSKGVVARIGRVLLGLFGAIVVIFVVIAGVVFAVSQSRLSRAYSIPVAPLTIPDDAATIARGKYLADAVTGCTDCHGENLGGKVFADAPPFRLVASNLTHGAGGVGESYTDADWVRAIRFAVRPDGAPLLFMPTQAFSQLGNDDLAAIVAYIKSATPTDNAPGRSELRPLGRALLVAGQLGLPVDGVDTTLPVPSAPSAGRTVEYGQYLAAVGACRECHGLSLAGAPPTEPDTPPGADLTPAGRLGTWSDDDFRRAMRTGIRPDGSQIHPAMPWRVLAKQSDDELAALYRYLRSLK